MPSLSIVIPVYRGAKTIPDLTAALAEELPRLTDTYEVIFVEDDGGDNSWQVIEQLATQYDFVRGIKLMRNFGQHNALLCGIRASNNDVIVTMDDDMQHPPTEIAKLLTKLDEGIDVVYGYPQDRQHGTGRNLGSSIIRRVSSIVMGVQEARYLSAFRAFKTHLRMAFEDYNSPYVSIDVLLSWSTKRFSVVNVEHKPRTVGTSGYNFAKLMNLAITMLTGFSVLPLRLASLLGFFLTLFGFVLLIYIIPIRFALYGYDAGVPGFTFLASMISIFSGAQMFMMGILGEYLARMHFRLMEKPSYVVLNSVNTQNTIKDMSTS